MVINLVTPHTYEGLAAVIAAQTLVTLLLDQPWHQDCEIIEGYMPPRPGNDTQPKCVVRFSPFKCFLRYSKVPKQGFFWDIYGDDMQTVELAMLAIHQAP